jgi:benzoyl-CoA reductase/2-hydroxyglutaryl-CoA dehydratase subunit BcrC/BadD/HgdB
MTVPTEDLRRYEQMVTVLEEVAQRRRQSAIRADAMYYQLLADYYARVLRARRDGGFVVAHTLMLPTEPLYAMDVVPLCMEVVTSTLMVLHREYEELIGTSKSFGLNPFLCSVHKSVVGAWVKGWVPTPDAVVWSKQACENTAMVGGALMDICRCPGYHVDRPYRRLDREIAYYAAELQGMVEFLEGLSGRRLDAAKLHQSIDYAGEMVDLQRQMYRLRQNVPCPSANRRSAQVQTINWLYFGTAEGVAFNRAILEEMTALVAQGKGYAPEERFRLLTLFPAPIHSWKVLDWMQQEFGVSVVADPFLSHWGEWEPQPEQGLLSVARRCFAIPACREMHGPAQEAMIGDAVADAEAFKADGVLYWANLGCSHGTATIRLLRDAIARELGLPFFVVDMEYCDPSIVAPDEIKERLEEFCELLAERK